MASIVCAGDYTADGEVTVNDVITMVDIALGNQAIASCEPGDRDGNGDITIDEILQAVNKALGGCG